jgi:hypothetical protein
VASDQVGGQQAMSENKTVQTRASVKQFLDGVEHERKRADSYKLLELFAEVTKLEPAMWGTSIVGYGSYHYRHESGREGDMPLVGFSPRKQSLTLYIMDGFEGYDRLLGKLGKHKTGMSCLYINKLEDVDLDVLRELVAGSYQHMRSSKA